jgi:hypothetical protein
VKTEEVNFNSNNANVEKNMDDLILKAGIWQGDYWVDCFFFSNFLVIYLTIKVTLFISFITLQPLGF